MDDILVIDHDQDFARNISQFLKHEGYQVKVASTSQDIERLAGNARLVLLDIDFGSRKEFDVAIELRRSFPHLGIIIVTGSEHSADQIVGLEVGADDFLSKYVDERVLLARIHSLFRRLPDRMESLDQGHSTFCFRDVVVDLATFSVTREGAELDLSSTEFLLLKLFIERPSRVLTREVISREVFKREWTPADRHVDVLVGKLRRKLGGHRVSEIIKTWRGVGYQFAVRIVREAKRE